MDARIVDLFKRSKGEAWEPPDREHPWLLELYERGYLQRCTMRCGFEAFDSGVRWTEAGKLACEAAMVAA